MAIDLDAARTKRAAAAREQKKKAPSMKFGGKSWVLPLELPVAAVDAIGTIANAEQAKDKDDEKKTEEDKTAQAASTGAIRVMLESLLGDQYHAFMALKPSMTDVGVIMDGLIEEYGIKPGESAASSES